MSSETNTEAFNKSVDEIIEELTRNKPLGLEEKIKDILQYADTLQQVEDLEFAECGRLQVFEIINQQFPLHQASNDSHSNSSQ